MVKCSVSQCKGCKTVFNAKWYRWTHGDGPWVPEGYHYSEYVIEQQKCPECYSGNLSLIGKVHISRKERKLLTIDFGECSPLLFPQTSNQKLI